MKFRYDAKLTTILVGTDKKKFVVHQLLLCSKSQFFNKALTGSFEESRTGIVKLEDISTVLFTIVVTWLYNGKIIYTTSEENSNMDKDFASLGLLSETPARVSEDTSTWPGHILVGLYLLADRLDMRMLRIDAINALNDMISRTGSSLNIHTYRLIDSNTTAQSPLRKFAIDRLVYGVKHKPVNRQFWADLPHTMAIEALVTTGQRLPCTLCDDCHRKGLLYNEMALAIDHPRKYRDVAPFHGGMCLYHEHTDDAEKMACRARRNMVVID